MHDIEPAAGQVVASDTQKSVEAVDQAVMSLAHLCASIVEVSKAEDLSRATRELIKIQNASNLETVAFGCPPLHKASARLSDDVAVDLAA